MTDRISHLTVALTEDLRDDDVQHVMGAILMLKNVAGVTGHTVDVKDYVARSRFRTELADKVIKLILTGET